MKALPLFIQVGIVCLSFTHKAVQLYSIFTVRGNTVDVDTGLLLSSYSYFYSSRINILINTTNLKIKFYIYIVTQATLEFFF